MKVWTAHLGGAAAAGQPARGPVLVPEAWSWGAALFGPFWLLAQRAWVPGIIVLAVVVIANLLVPPALRPVLVLGFGLLLGLMGQDLVRWSLARRGYALAQVVAAPDEEAALLRLLDARPDVREALAAEARPLPVPQPPLVMERPPAPGPVASAPPVHRPE